MKADIRANCSISLFGFKAVRLWTYEGRSLSDVDHLLSPDLRKVGGASWSRD